MWAAPIPVIGRSSRMSVDVDATLSVVTCVDGPVFEVSFLNI